MRNERMTRWGIAVVRIAAGIVFFAHGSQKVFVFGLGAIANMPNGFEFAFTMLAVSVALALAGPGSAALDPVIFKGCG